MSISSIEIANVHLPALFIILSIFETPFSMELVVNEVTIIALSVCKLQVTSTLANFCSLEALTFISCISSSLCSSDSQSSSSRIRIFNVCLLSMFSLLIQRFNLNAFVKESLFIQVNTILIPLDLKWSRSNHIKKFSRCEICTNFRERNNTFNRSIPL